MAVQTYYAGPGKVYFNGLSILPDGENGQLRSMLTEKKTDRGSAMYGQHLSTLDDQMIETSLTPFDQWALLPTLFPAWLGVTTAAGSGTWSAGGTGALKIGTNPFDPANAGTKFGSDIWTPDGRLYAPYRSAITKVPGMKLGVGQSLFEEMTLTSLLTLPGDANPNQLFPSNAITESGAADPDSTGFSPDFVNGHWSASWGAITGFTGMEAEDFFQIVPDVKYQPFTVGKVTRIFKLVNSRFMVKARLVGPTQTQIIGKIAAHTAGTQLTEGSATDLVLTHTPTSKTITLKNCEIFGSGFEFGGTKLGTGETGFVTSLTGWTAGQPGPLMIFSA